MHLRGILPALTSVALCTVLAGCSTPIAVRPASATADAAPDRTVPEDPAAAVDAALAALDRRAEVAQLFVAGVALDDLGDAEALVAQGVGGVFLAGRSAAPATELAATTARWQQHAPGPGLWIAVDQEGGAVQTLKGEGFERLPAAAEQGALPAGRLAGLADGLGRELSSAGVNLNLAPVADVVPAGTEEGNEPIGAFGRQYAGTGPEVAEDAAAVADGLAAHGVVPTFKHFPGLGLVQGNTDTRAGVVDPVTDADGEQVTAFAEALARTSADGFVMTSSATYPRIDPENQAAFSRTVVTDLLRDRLGFDGVVVSDDLANATAVQGIPVGERATRFLAAGGTLVLSCDGDLVPEMVEAVLARAEADPGFADVVDAAVRTALTAKAEAGLLG
ncbi:beta-N-acetylhexosaminidase [Blastococcus sp. DSM 46786]|uniref:glycoside hydrolase family 3 N-terminal domain-containing protein n=1 Tax=Blastococcus sp. DSM 46786 TaxID=1798227 RepID=UPI0008BF98FA|nr:glycoside hydrolase family 3 N-terminal domain-containing protein [Blastococcus sp. DSM 46786]SEL88980.1 beta-N-acetylhexosaminidase [Blastococcus sp. DSM 46786]